jgi:hypothetical protein
MALVGYRPPEVRLAGAPNKLGRSDLVRNRNSKRRSGSICKLASAAIDQRSQAKQ